MLRVSLWSLLVTLGFTLLFGLGGLVYGCFQTAHIDIAEYRRWFIPADVTNLRRFLCAGYLHDASYLGGVLAIFVAWAFHVVVRVRTKEATSDKKWRHEMKIEVEKEDEARFLDDT